MTTVTISLPDSLKEFIEQEVQTKGYGNVSEYVRGLLREAQQKQASAQLERLLLEGLASGEGAPLTRDFWKQLRADAGRILAKNKVKRRRRTSR
ncbi:MAG: type II toxin-antitoxin system ParD family antitoxin [Acidobacteriia bacterium]|nr:type II toxin-antitoxin system ParD family antitoxin [Terriglobia bacterium]